MTPSQGEKSWKASAVQEPCLSPAHRVATAALSYLGKGTSLDVHRMKSLAGDRTVPGCLQPPPDPGWAELSPPTTIPALPPGHSPCNAGLIPSAHLSLLLLPAGTPQLWGHKNLLKTPGSTQNPRQSQTTEDKPGEESGVLVSAPQG